MVLEKVPASLAQKVSEMIAVPVIGIGAGADVDGQVLVLQDMLGMDESFRPKFVRRFAMLGEQITAGISSYVSAVKDKSFPSQDESY